MGLIEVKQLTKHFGAIRAVNDVSFSIPAGICFGLLGPNGAGKTTTIEILEGITSPTSGEVLYRGEPLGKQFREQAGIMFQTTQLQDYMTVIEALRMFGSFYTDTVEEAALIEQCSLGEFLHQDTRRLSGGQKQRLLLAIALVNNPDIIFLDEPTTGLDPQARRNFWSLLNRIKEQGKTILLTTHYMEEASLLCDQLVFMDHGKIIAEGTPRELIDATFNDAVLLLPATDFSASRTDTDFHIVTEGRDVIEITTSDMNRSITTLLDAGVSLSRLQIRARNLEDLFLNLTGGELRS